VEFALSHPHEYELYYLHEYELLFSASAKRTLTLNQTFKENRPAVEMMRGKMAKQLGGTPEHYTAVTLAVWALLHGTAMLLIAKTVHPGHAEEMRAACRSSVDTLMEKARSRRSKK
jgi:hypothetical protein